MRNIWLVLKREVIVTFKKKSFWILTFLMPAIIMVFNGYYIFLENDLTVGQEESVDSEESDSTSAPEFPIIGLVDEAGLISEIPESIPPGIFLPFKDETAARAALQSEEIDQYVMISEDYLIGGEVTVFDKDFQILESGEDMGVSFNSNFEWMLAYLINYNLAGDEILVNTIRNPTPGVLAEYNRVNPPDEASEIENQAMAQLVAQAMPYIFYFVLIISSGYMLQSVTAEKENRTVEVLLLSLNPSELMIGKILGLTVIVMIQLLVWVGGGRFALGQSAALFDLSGFDFPPGFFISAILFMLLGYLLYASVMAAVGAIANTAREGGQMTWILIIPLMPTLMFAQKFLEEPHGTMSVVLSLFPFSAPSAMVTRMAVADVPIWQIAISLAGVALTAYLFVTLAGRFFRSGNLLSEAQFSWRRFANAWRE